MTTKKKTKKIKKPSTTKTTKKIKKPPMVTRINISVTSPRKLAIIDKAAAAAEMSRSAYIIDAALERAQTEQENAPCEVCGKLTNFDEAWAWHRVKKYGTGEHCCARCVDSINELPDETVLAVLKARK